VQVTILFTRVINCILLVTSKYKKLVFCRTNENESIIQLMMDRLPQERLKRNVVRGRLDVIGKLHIYFILFI